MRELENVCCRRLHPLTNSNNYVVIIFYELIKMEVGINLNLLKIIIGGKLD